MSARKLAPGIVFFLLATLLYSPTLRSFFYADDFDWLYTAQRVLQGKASLLTPVGRSRPLTLLWFALFFPLFHLHPLPYHSLNLLLHGATTTLLFYLARFFQNELSLPKLFPYLAAALFCILPLHVQPVVWVSYIQDQLALSFALTYLWLTLRGKRGGSIFYFLSLGFKEHALFLPFVATFALSLQRAPRRSILAQCSLPLFAGLAFLLLYRHLPIALGTPKSLFDAEPHLGWNLFKAALNLAELVAAFLMGFPPIRGFAAISPSPLFFSFAPFFLTPLFLFFLVFVTASFRVLSPIKMWLLVFFLFFAASLLPASTLPYLQTKSGAFFAPFRYFYFADPWLALLLSAGFCALRPGREKGLGIAYFSFLTLFSLASLFTWQRFHYRVSQESQRFAALLQPCPNAIVLAGFPEELLLSHRNHLRYLKALLAKKPLSTVTIHFSPAANPRKSMEDRCTVSYRQFLQCQSPHCREATHAF